MPLPTYCMRFCKSIELVGDLFRRVPHRLVAADQIGVRVDENRPVISKASQVVQIEEDGAAAEKRLDVNSWLEARSAQPSSPPSPSGSSEPPSTPGS